MTRFILALAFLLIAGTASASPGCTSFTTIQPGAVLSNPNVFAACPGSQPQSYAQIGHLALIKSASMTSTSDQTMTMLALPAKYQVTSIYVTNCSATPAGALGGIYTAASKGGTAIVAATQAYTSLTTATSVQALTINIATSLTAGQYYFALTSGASSGSPTCDVYVDGIGLQ